MDLYFKTENEEALWTALISAGVAEEVEEQQLRPSVGNAEPELVTVTVRRVKQGQNLDIIGEIWKPTGEIIRTKSLDGADIEVPEMAPVEGFHANFRGGLTDVQVTELSSIIIPSPATPYRVWA